MQGLSEALQHGRGSMWKLVVTSTLVLSSILKTQAAQQALATSSQLVPAHLTG